MFEEITKIFLNNGFLITKAQTARLLGVKKPRITQMIKEGKLNTVKVLGVEMIKFSELQK